VVGFHLRRPARLRPGIKAWIVVFVLLLAAAAHGQSDRRPPRIGYLSLGPVQTPTDTRSAYALLVRALRARGQRTAVFAARFAEGRSERLPAMAAELIGLGVDVIVAASTPAIEAAREMTRTTPIVMDVSAEDPVSRGLVASLDRPGGNITGLMLATPQLAVKRLSLLKQAFPASRRVGVLARPSPSSSRAQLAALTPAARSMGLQLEIVEATAGRYDAPFATLKERGVDSVLVLSEPMFLAHAHAILAAVHDQRLPAIYDWREFAEAGGLLAYAPEPRALRGRTAFFVDRLLRGAKAADLRVEEPPSFEFVVNLKSARALGITFSVPLLKRADYIID